MSTKVRKSFLSKKKICKIEFLPTIELFSGGLQMNGGHVVDHVTEGIEKG